MRKKGIEGVLYGTKECCTRCNHTDITFCFACGAGPVILVTLLLIQVMHESHAA